MGNNKKEHLFNQLALELIPHKSNSIPLDLDKRIKAADLSPFITRSEKLHALDNNIRKKPVCEVCGNAVNFRSRSYGYNANCSVRCVALNPKITQKKQLTCIDRYGETHANKNREVMARMVENNRDAGSYIKGQQTFLKNYGVSNVYQLDTTKEKIKHTNLERYGVENPLQNSTVKAKVADTVKARYGVAFNPVVGKRTTLERYGVENVLQCPEIKSKVAKTTIARYGTAFNPVVQRQTNLERYGAENAMQNLIVSQKGQATKIDVYNNWKLPIRLDKIYTQVKTLPLFTKWIGAEHSYKWRHETCGSEFESNLVDGKLPICPKCKPRSIPQQQVKDFLSTLDIEVVENDRNILRPKELDFWLPAFNIGIEVNGVYWHREGLGPGIGEKSKLMESRGLQLLHFWDLEINQRFPAVKNIIMGVLDKHERIQSRDCEFLKISEDTAREFLEEWHLNGFDVAHHHHGIFYDEILVGVCSMNKKENTINIERFAVANFNVINGLDSVLLNMQEEYNFDKVEMAVNGNTVNRKLMPNWQCEISNKVDYFWMKNGRQVSSPIKEDALGVEFNSELCEEENMTANGYFKCVNAGTLIFSKEY